jgi:hypothetical protein
VRMIEIALRKSEIGKSREGLHPIHPLLPQARRGEKLQVQPNPSIAPIDSAPRCRVEPPDFRHENQCDW